jgi:16S rRNA (uracil1498-N3)-methyltransferase
VPRFLIKPEQIQDGRVTLTSEAHHHATRVLRLGVGDRMVVFHSGGEYDAVIDYVDARSLAGRVVLERSPPHSPPVSVTVIQSLLKADGMDWVIEKCSELGVEALTPAVTRRTVVMLSGTRAAARRARWKRIAAASAQQCGRPQPLRVSAVTPLPEAIASAGPDLLLVPYEAERERSIAEVLRKHREACTVAIAIGPEGGFASEEVDLLATADGIPVSLGPRTLRSGTAAIAAATIVLYELGGLEPSL